MDKLERDLEFFKMELEAENDPLRRTLIEEEITKIKWKILHTLREERKELDRQNENMQKRLDQLEASKKK
jgi:malate synthase